jgi:hypothetical protein
LIGPTRESIPTSVAGDMTTFLRDVREQVLAHVVADETEAACRRSDSLAKQRQLMGERAAHCAGRASQFEAGSPAPRIARIE